MKKKVIIIVLVVAILVAALGFGYYELFYKSNKTTPEVIVDDGFYVCSKRVLNEEIYGSNQVIHEYNMNVSNGNISDLKYYEILFYADTEAYQSALSSNDFGDMTVAGKNEERLFIELYSEPDNELSYNDFIATDDLQNYDCILSESTTDNFQKEVLSTDKKYKCIKGKEVAVLTVDTNDYITSMYQGSIKEYSDSATYYSDKANDQAMNNEYLLFEYDDKNYTITQLAVTRLDSNPTFTDLKNGQFTNYTCSQEYN